MQKLDALLGVYLKKPKKMVKIFFYKRKENNFGTKKKDV